ncbi:DUF488 family protein [Saccharopolyspora erythraea]|nr:DUF488 domain-containing protein [Saccharopolyspora erythraea]
MRGRNMAKATLLTVGHGTAAKAEIVRLLRSAGVTSLVDVRTAPGSRRNPDMSRSAMEHWLPREDIAYRWDRRLGGFRKLTPDSPDLMWRNESFRAYAGHMRTPEFVDAADELAEEAHTRTTAIMCGESLWWRCHRRMISDFLQLTRGIAVRHLMHDGSITEHQPIRGVRVRDDGLLVYDGGQQTLDST